MKMFRQMKGLPEPEEESKADALQAGMTSEDGKENVNILQDDIFAE